MLMTLRLTCYFMLIGALFTCAALAGSSERKRNAAKPDYDAYKKELAFEMVFLPQSRMEAGKPADVLLKLVDTKSGLAVPGSFLRHYKSHPFHLILVDGALADFQLVHPAPTATDGLYRFTFTPRSAGGYRGWAHVVSIENKTQFVMADLGNYAGKPLNTKPQLIMEQKGYRFALAFDDEPKTKRTSDGVLTITDAAGKAIQPDAIYIVGINEDRRSILKTKLEKDSLTEFEIKPEMPGYTRFFVRATFGSQTITAAFGFTVGGKKPDENITFESIFK